VRKVIEVTSLPALQASLPGRGYIRAIQGQRGCHPRAATSGLSNEGADQARTDEPSADVKRERGACRKPGVTS